MLSHICLARCWERKRNLVGRYFWTRGAFVSTVSRDQELICNYIPLDQKGEKSAWSSSRFQDGLHYVGA